MLDRPIKVLWFTNTPSLASEFLNVPSIGGGWIYSLEEKIKEDQNINLAIAFKHGQEKLNKFTKKNCTYYAIPNCHSKIKRLAQRHFAILDDDELIDYCLKIIHDFKPDIINIFGTEEGFGLIVDKINLPVVIHLQGILTVYKLKWFAAKINKFDLISSSGFKSLLTANTLFHFYNYFKKTAYREQQIFKRCKYFMGRTDWDRRITSVLSPQSKYFTCNEVLRKPFRENIWSKKPGSKKVLISTIQSNVYKGLETILETAVILKEANQFNFNWIVAGISPQDVIVKIFERKTGLRFNDYDVTLAGKVGVEDLVKLELNADIFIHPSHIDNSPNSLCEAMLLGMPIVATCAGGSGSMLMDGKEGILIQDGDPYSLAGATLELIKDPVKAAEFGKNARARAIVRHDLDVIVRNVVGIYSEILGG
ncbi:glycosyltransferase family 4 protein [Chryseolinea sp. H1M3-3]|uniref:glycosyltransferase n=1 Tax=Chryseolinea sp. H1M3-3 TaxID=3034144 RepID=UPI0023EB88E1|nr:glycosyltransferase family 4 protein [Chryseolinea sp. H1M3-3]